MPTLASMLLDKLARGGDKDALFWLEGDTWRAMRWSDTELEVAGLAEELTAMGVGKGDRIAILGGPHPRWLAVDFATLAIGAVSVGIYPTLRPEAIRWQLRHAGARVLFAESRAAIDALGDLGECPDLRHALAWDLPVSASPDLATFRERARAVLPEDPAALFYTSGTTGDPKGAVVTHGAMAAVCEASRVAVPLQPGDSSMIFLPLAHSLQRMVAYRGLLEDVGAWFCPSLDRFAEVLQKARPSVLATVPRMLEKIKAKAEAGLAQRSPRERRIFAWAMEVGRERSRRLESGQALPLALKLRYALADRLVFRGARARFGGRLRLLAVGGARLDPEVARFFHAMGISVCEAWGLTETCAPATMNTPDHFRFGTVGRPLPGVEVRLDDDGEVLVRGPNLFAGYWRDPDATAACMTPDGYFRTGDIGRLEDGFLRIVDRKKEILVTSGGKNIPPVNIEKKLEGGGVAQAIVIGNDRPYLVALLAPDPDHPVADPDAVATARVREANAGLAPYEQIKRWAWLPTPLTPESGLLTPTLKLRRRAIDEAYRPLIDRLYA